MSSPQILQVKYCEKIQWNRQIFFYAYITIHELCTVVHLVFDLKVENIKN